jgi:hypothetical protein
MSQTGPFRRFHPLYRQREAKTFAIDRPSDPPGGQARSRKDDTGQPGKEILLWREVGGKNRGEYSLWTGDGREFEWLGPNG